MVWKNKRVWVAGHTGLVGSALVCKLHEAGAQLLLVDRQALDLRQLTSVAEWASENKPEVVFMAAGNVGGIQANQAYPASMMTDNLRMTINVLMAASFVAVEKLVYIGSGCMYPTHLSYPMSEPHLYMGAPENTNRAYAVAKLAGMEMTKAFNVQHDCRFITAILPNLYGPHDNLAPQNSHVVPALIQRILRAKRAGTSVVIGGSGKPYRQFMHVDDAADALMFLAQEYEILNMPINVGQGSLISIGVLAADIARLVGFTGGLEFDRRMADGAAYRALAGDRLAAMGWKPKIAWEDGLRRTIEWVAGELGLSL
jgi:GDP-L-fucose synthase